MPRSVSPQRPVFGVLAMLVAVYAGWYGLYELWLLPDGRLDSAVAHHAALLAGRLLDALGPGSVVDGRLVRLPSGSGVLVADACTGLAVVGLFAGFVLAYPGRWRDRAWFLPLGVLAVHLANAVRIAFLAWFVDVWPDLFVPVHQWGAQPFFYAVVFALWMAWVRLGPRPAETPTERVFVVPTT